MSIYKILLLLLVTLASMDILRKRNKELFAIYNEVQLEFDTYYREAESSAATYVFSNKTLLTEKSFTDKYLQTKREYENTLSEFRKLKKLYNFSITYTKSDYANIDHRFVDDLNIKMANSIKEFRVETRAAADK